VYTKIKASVCLPNDSIKERNENEDNLFLALTASISNKKLQCCAGRVKTSETRKKKCTRDRFVGKLSLHQLKKMKYNIIKRSHGEKQSSRRDADGTE
jgi:hypothetical protein